jgi:4-hydroxy-tetrahydrodipicolinate reductase
VIHIAIIGAGGRMGRSLTHAAAELSNVKVVGAVASKTSSTLGKDTGLLAGMGASGLLVSSDLSAALAAADIAIDFSSAQATRSNLAACVAARKPLLIGTTGFDPADLADDFAAAARAIPLLVAANTSVAVNLLMELVRSAAAALPGFDIEIIEAHHRMKRDAPSGTALALGRAAAEGRGRELADVAVAGRGDAPTASAAGTGPGPVGHSITSSEPRHEGEIGFAVVRGGDIVGDHTVLFAGTGERLALGHQATDRAVFARGALKAGLWLAAQPPGRYFMRDIFTDKSIG